MNTCKLFHTHSHFVSTRSTFAFLRADSEHIFNYCFTQTLNLQRVSIWWKKQRRSSVNENCLRKLFLRPVEEFSTPATRNLRGSADFSTAAGETVDGQVTRDADPYNTSWGHLEKHTHTHLHAQTQRKHIVKGLSFMIQVINTHRHAGLQLWRMIMRT